MSNLPDFALQQHRVYVLRDFKQELNGDILCSGYAPSNPNSVIAARFKSATIVSSWQDIEDSSKLAWPLEVIGFHTVRLAGKRFRFTLDCLDFHCEWESEWPQLL